MVGSCAEDHSTHVAVVVVEVLLGSICLSSSYLRASATE